MRNRQSGLTFLGLLLLILVVGTWVYAGIRLTPIYLEYMKIVSTLDKVQDEFSANPGTTEQMIRIAVDKHFDVEYVNIITQKDLIIKRDGDVFRVTASYEETAPFAFNIYFLVTFDRTVEIQIR